MTPTTLAAFLLCASLAAASVPASQKQALLDLYSATNGNNWIWAGYPSWSLAADPCENEWFGVTCDPSNSTILCVAPVACHVALGGTQIVCVGVCVSARV